MIEPRAGAFPLAGDSGTRDRQRIGHFLLRQAAEVSKLHDPALTSVERRQLVQRFVEHQDVAAGRLRRRNLFVEINTNPSAGTLGGATLSRVVDKNAPHRLSGDRVEVPAVLPRGAVVASESQECLVNERSGLQRVVDALMTQIPGCAFAQLVIDQRHQFVARAQVAARPCMQKLADRANAVAHATAFEAYSIHDFDVRYFRRRRSNVVSTAYLAEGWAPTGVAWHDRPSGRVLRLYHSALACQPAEREPLLTEACATDDDLHREVERLLAQDPPAAR